MWEIGTLGNSYFICMWLFVASLVCLANLRFTCSLTFTKSVGSQLRPSLPSVYVQSILFVAFDSIKVSSGFLGINPEYLWYIQCQYSFQGLALMVYHKHIDSLQVARRTRCWTTRSSWDFWRQITEWKNLTCAQKLCKLEIVMASVTTFIITATFHFAPFRCWISRGDKSSAHRAKIGYTKNSSILYLQGITYILPKGSGLVTK